MPLYQQHQRGDHHQLVCDRVEKRAKWSDLPHAAGEIAIYPVGHRSHGKHQRRHQQVVLERQVEHYNQHRDQQDA